jgi:solute carrier family 25 (peroxisomal adenine nucleotide transporter), member 17
MAPSISQPVDQVMHPPPPPWIHAMSGAIGGALALIALYPLERIRVEMQKELKIQQQQQDKDDTTFETDQVETIEFHSTPLKQLTANDQHIVDRTIDCKDTMIGESWSFESLNIINANDDTFHDAVPEMKVPVVENRRHVQQTIISYIHTLLASQTLYRGITPVVTTLTISNFIFFYLNEWFKNQFQSLSTTTGIRHSNTARYRSLLASCLAGICNVLLTNPLWVSNMRMTTGESQYSNNIFFEMKYILQKYGIQHLWSGTTASLLLVSNPVIHFFIYEQVKAWQIRRQRRRRNISPLQAFVMGAIAKTIATLLTYPIQVTQSLLRMQEKQEISEAAGTGSINHNEDKRPTDKSTLDGCRRFNGTFDCLIQLYQRNGINGLYTGLRAKLLQTVLTAAFTFLTYEQIVQVLHNIHYQSTLLQRQQRTIQQQKAM